MVWRKQFFPVLIVFLLGVCPDWALAGTYSGGTGEPNNPYLIYDANQMNAIGADPCNWDKHFKLMADIDLSRFTGTDFNIIGRRSIKPFAGVFDGASHKIRNFSYASGETGYIGLFGQLDHSGEIRNLGVENAHIDAGDRWEIGALVGINYGGTIRNCYTTGSLSADGSAGGLVGSNRGTISTCYSTVSVTGQVWGFGGLAGYNRGSITHCYATGAVEGDKRTGGLVGFNYTEGIISHCYAAGLVTGQHEVGGLVGCGSYKVSNCFWDIDTSGQSRSAGGKGLTTAKMQTASTFIGWNTCGQVIWKIDQGNDYPRFLWEDKPGEPLPSELSAYVTGAGTEQEPYLVLTADQLNTIGLFKCEWDKHFRLMADIDLRGLAGTGFNVIGYWNSKHDNEPFTGIFDGNGHTISNFTSDNAAYYIDYFALFGYIGSNGEVKDLAMEDVNIVIEGSAASLVGANDGKISNCHATGVVAGGRANAVGGLVAGNSGMISACYAAGSVSGSGYVGGLVAGNSGTISACYATASVKGGYRAGGLAGENHGLISDCYATGSVTGGWAAGGLVGYLLGDILNCYATGPVAGDDFVGGLLGDYRGGWIEGSFYDKETTGQSSPSFGLTTAQMQMRSTFTDAGWDFVGETANGTDDIWDICEGTNYPRLVWQVLPGNLICPDSVDFFDFAVFAEYWLQTGCGQCGGVDLTGDSNVDVRDLSEFSNNWLTGIQ